MLCVGFSSKPKATNVLPKHILTWKARDQSIQATNKLFCHLIVNSHLCNVLCKFLIKIESTWRHERTESSWIYCQDYQKQPPKAFYKNFAISTANTCVGVFIKKLQVWRPAAFLTVSMAHSYMVLKSKVSKSRLYDGVRLQDLSVRFGFLFLSRHLSSWTECRIAFENLRQIPLIVN